MENDCEYAKYLLEGNRPIEVESLPIGRISEFEYKPIQYNYVSYKTLEQIYQTDTQVVEMSMKVTYIGKIEELQKIYEIAAGIHGTRISIIKRASPNMG